MRRLSWLPILVALAPLPALAQWTTLRQLTAASAADSAPTAASAFVTVGAAPGRQVEVCYRTGSTANSPTSVDIGIWRLDGAKVDRIYVRTILNAQIAKPLCDVIPVNGTSLYATLEAFTGGSSPTVTLTIAARPFDGSNVSMVKAGPVQVEGYANGQPVPVVTSSDSMVQGTVAHDAVDTGNPVKAGGKAAAIGSVPTAVTAGDRVNDWNTLAGAKVTVVQPATTATAPTDVAITNSATLVHTSAAGVCAVIVQNDENAVVSCGQTTAVTLTGPGNKLKACTADDDGTGGSVTYQGYAGNVYCITAATAQVNVQPTACAP